MTTVNTAHYSCALLRKYLPFYQINYCKSIGGEEHNFLFMPGAQLVTVVVASSRFSNLIPVRIVLSDHFPFLTVSLEQIPSPETKRFAASQEILHIL
jgi:hypothetical protein